MSSARAGQLDVLVDPRVRSRLPPPVRRGLVRSLRRLVRAAGGPEARVELRVCDDAAMIQLHADTFGERHSTDVLSFPAGPPVPGAETEGMLGTIVLNWDAVRRQATRPGLGGCTHEAATLCLHAVAHLCGHDHARRADARRMLEAERRLGRRIGARPVRPYGGLR